jgi:hypothetical protein
MKSIWGIMKDKVVETNDCWIEDLEKTIKLKPQPNVRTPSPTLALVNFGSFDRLDRPNFIDFG